MNQDNEMQPEDMNETPEAAPAETDPVAALAEENAALKDQMLRLAADMENLRKRTAREVADARAYAISNFARDMLVASDNVERALSVLPAEVRQSADATLKALIEGLEMTGREMTRLMQKNGVALIEAEGQRFDPHKHQAMFEVPDAAVPEGTVVQVVQQGYQIGDRVLRPAMVGVSKGGAVENPAEIGEGSASVDKEA